jgi:hypothetical protein
MKTVKNRNSKIFKNLKNKTRKNRFKNNSSVKISNKSRKRKKNRNRNRNNTRKFIKGGFSFNRKKTPEENTELAETNAETDLSEKEVFKATPGLFSSIRRGFRAYGNQISFGQELMFVEGHYDGQTQRGYRHGEGTLTYNLNHSRDIKYEFKLYVKEPSPYNLKLISYDIYVFEKYDGHWKYNTKHGFGTMYYINDNKSIKVMYRGYWKNDKREGKNGTMKYKDGTVYDGQWNNDQRHGVGFMYYDYTDKLGKSGKLTYSGNWKNNKIHGEGTMEYDDGSVFSGHWVNGTFINGKIKYKNGDVYDGHWKHHTYNGIGTMTYKNGDVYEGNWEDGKFFGNGKLIVKTDRSMYNNIVFYKGVYEGKFVKGKLYGIVNHTYPNEGECVEQWLWRSGKLNIVDKQLKNVAEPGESSGIREEEDNLE